MNDRLFTALVAGAPAQLVIRAVLVHHEELYRDADVDLLEPLELVAVFRLAADRLDASPDDELAVAVGAVARAMIMPDEATP